MLGEFSLSVHHLLYIRLEFIEHLVVAFRNRAGYDERRTGVVHQHRVHLIDNRVIMMFALHEILHLRGHIVAQIVETEFVVRAECDVGGISLAPLRRIGLRFIDTSYGEAVELVNRSHPFRVAAGKIIVHGHHMHSFSGKSVEEYGQCGYEGLTLAGSHLGDVIGHLVAIHHAVEHHASDQLHVIVHHVPSHGVATGHP